MEIIFWVATGLVLYVYAGYPAVAWLLVKLIGRPANKADIEPSVSVVIAARNEAPYIERTIQNKLDQDYPPEKLDVIVVSDESTDGTDDVVRKFPERVTLLRQEPRQGKTAGLNLAIKQAHSDILVLSDANSLYKRDAIRKLVRNFADESVGYVTGQMNYADPSGSFVGSGTSAYMRYENFLRKQESLLGSVIGVDGGIDAVRRSLYRDLRADQQSDFVLPLAIAGEGHRVVYEEEAIQVEETLSDQRSEYLMRVRVALRAMWALWDNRRLLLPFGSPLLAFQIWSHKVLRYFVFVPAVLAVASCAVLATSSVAYLAALGAGFVFVLLGLSVWLRNGRGHRLALVPYYLILVNVSFAHAAVKFALGKRQAVWNPRTG